MRGHDGATGVAVEDDRIVFVGSDDQASAYDGADEVHDLAGAWLTPSFVDHHVHAVRTGFARTGLDLTDLPSLAAVLEAVAAHARRSPGVVIGQGWDETDWPEGRTPTGQELDRAAPGRLVYTTRVDSHSAVISPTLAEQVPGLAGIDGWTPDGRVERHAHHAVRDALETLVGDDERLAAAAEACRAMAALGIGEFHENAAPHIGPAHEVALVRRAAEGAGLRSVVYWGELMGLSTARELGVAGLAGDLVADGAIGSRTAGLTTAYADHADSCGHVYLTPEQVRDHVVACTETGLQAGFHAIGDAALHAVDEGFLAAEASMGTERLRAGRHRLEHVEMPSPRLVSTLARIGVTASVQPLFDRLWGGPDQMYAARLGDRWQETNPFAVMHAAGVRLAFGSDSPVTPLGPWAAIRAAVHHHHEPFGLDLATAFDAHTGQARVAPGEPADLAVWSEEPDDDLEAPDPELRLLMVAGLEVTR